MSLLINSSDFIWRASTRIGAIFMVQKILLLMTCCWLAISSTAFAARPLMGKVTNAIDGAAISGVRVEVKKSTIVTSTDLFGVFTLDVPDSAFILVCSFVGMLPRETIVTDQDIVDVTLLPESEGSYNYLEQTLSTAGKKAEKVSDIPASVVVITRQEITKFGYRTLEEILENVTGLYMLEDNNWTGAGGILGVRGFFSVGMNNNIIIMINGVNQLEDYWGFYPLTRLGIPVEAIDRIEVVRGPMSVIYGSGAFFGAINIITDQYDKNSKSVNVGSLGSEQTSKLASRVGGIQTTLSYVVNGAMHSTNGLNQPFTKMISNYNGDVKSTKGFLEDRRKFFNFSGKHRGFSMSMNFSQSDKEMFLDNTNYIQAIPKDDGNMAHMVGVNAGVSYDKNFSDKFSMTGKIGYFTHRSFQDYVSNGHFYGYSTFFSNAYDLELSAFLTPSAKLDLMLGLHQRTAFDLHTTFDIPDFGSNSTNSYIRIPDGETVQTQSFYSQANFHVKSNLTLVAGMRLERLAKYRIMLATGSIDSLTLPKEDTYEHDNFELIPRFAAIYSLNKNNAFKLLYGEATKRPSFGQNTDKFGSEEQLKPAVIQTLELNYIATIPDKAVINISLYENNLTDLIMRASTNDGGSLIYVSRNFGRIRTRGLEMGIVLPYFKSWLLDLSGTYNSSKDETAGYGQVDVNYSPTFLGYMKIAYQATKKTNVGLTGRYTGKMVTEWDPRPQSETKPDPPGRIGRDVAAYFLLNANVRVADIVYQNLYVAIKLENLLDTDYNYPTTTNNAWADKGFSGPGRAVFFTIGYEF